MQYRIIENEGNYFPQYKHWWQLHYRYIEYNKKENIYYTHRFSTLEEAEKCISVFKDSTKYIVHKC